MLCSAQTDGQLHSAVCPMLCTNTPHANKTTSNRKPRPSSLEMELSFAHSSNSEDPAQLWLANSRQQGATFGPTPIHWAQSHANALSPFVLLGEKWPACGQSRSPIVPVAVHSTWGRCLFVVVVAISPKNPLTNGHLLARRKPFPPPHASFESCESEVLPSIFHSQSHSTPLHLAPLHSTPLHFTSLWSSPLFAMQIPNCTPNSAP